MSISSSTQKQFGDDSYFFLGLQAADNGDEENAKRFFKLARDSESGTALVARRSAESLTMIGNISERNEASRFLAKKYGDDAAFLTAAREFFKQDEFSALISMTDSIDFATAPNELVKLRLNSMLQKNDSRFEHEYYVWSVSRPLSADHLEFYQKFLSNKITNFQKQQSLALSRYESEIKERQREWRLEWQKAHPDEEVPEDEVPTYFEGVEFENAELPVTDEQLLIDFRVLVYHRDYREAYRLFPRIFEVYENRALQTDFEENDDEQSEDLPPLPLKKEVPLFFDEQILSDIGKAHLYGTDSASYSVRVLDTISRRLSDEQSFYTRFYAARLCDRNSMKEAAESRFRAALLSTTDSKKFDNCLWYLLSSQLKSGVKEIISTLRDYGSKISDKAYFDDFFQTLSFQLLSTFSWQDFFDVWKNAANFMSDEAAGKFAYISARLLEEKLATASDVARDIFFDCLSRNASVYYKVCAIERIEQIEKENRAGEIGSFFSESDLDLILRNKKNVEIEPAPKSELEETKKSPADVLLSGYATFGFPARIYPEWLLNRANISLESSISASSFLYKCGLNDSKYNLQSLRIADRTKNSLSGEIPQELLHLVYPRFFLELISASCEENSIPEPLLYALVRTESFFEPGISSSAGASGLTQLMEATANDEARKLHLPEGWDIFDPETNLRMGSHYLSSLILRVDGNVPLLALFAYNGGLTNVRAWLRKSNREWKKMRTSSQKDSLPIDLFLETLDFKETRGYGRSLVAATAMYGYLYYGTRPEHTVRFLFGYEKNQNF